MFPKRLRMRAPWLRSEEAAAAMSCAQPPRPKSRKSFGLLLLQPTCQVSQAFPSVRAFARTALGTCVSDALGGLSCWPLTGREQSALHDRRPFCARLGSARANRRAYPCVSYGGPECDGKGPTETAGRTNLGLAALLPNARSLARRARRENVRWANCPQLSRKTADERLFSKSAPSC
jgi:hypothetical protein